uniref:ATP synthase complex subunit 8 n=1 Tax=Macroscelides proboscideus TaxID=29082 RepID=Q8LWV2_MACPR|nr:ATP synthase F0 subunit 8 [Macroscelides proboscideus]WEW63411.1 ATP synthase F0 subunit 8 [Macroscelides proboscideus]CAD13399.1 ATPase8 protein [Macroscelides proboscideus]
MPQLDTTPWFTVIMSMLITLFILFQTNTSKFITPLDPINKNPKSTTKTNPWDTKWTKIYLPHSLHQH